MIRQIWLALFHLHDIPNIHTKFDNNPSSSFRDYLSNKNRQRRTDERQTETGELFFRTLKVMNRRENMKAGSRRMDSIMVLS